MDDRDLSHAINQFYQRAFLGNTQTTVLHTDPGNDTAPAFMNTPFVTQAVSLEDDSDVLHQGLAQSEAAQANEYNEMK